MSWPIPVFLKIEYPRPISLRVWLPTLVALGASTVAAVLLLWPHGTPTNTLQFWSVLIGAPLVACALAFGVRLDHWEEEQTDAEEAEKEQDRLRALWRVWSRRNLHVVDAAAFPAATDQIANFANENVDLPTNMDRAVAFEWAKGHSAVLSRIRLLRLVAMRFADNLRDRREVIITLMLDGESLKHAEIWNRRAERVFSGIVPGVILRVEAQTATSGLHWITQLVDRVDAATRLVIAAQLWPDGEDERQFSEGVAAFLIEPAAAKAGAIFRPMTSARDILELGLAQIMETQVPPERLTHVWSTGCDADDSSALRAAVKADPKDRVIEHLLDGALGNAGPASGWIALAIAMEAMRGAGPQLVAWREPESESLYMCMVSPLPQKETTV